MTQTRVYEVSAFWWDCSDTINSSPDFEVSLLRLIDKVTNGTVIEISYTGTYLCFLRLYYNGQHLERHIVTASNSESDRSQVYSNDLWATTHVAGAL